MTLRLNINNTQPVHNPDIDDDKSKNHSLVAQQALLSFLLEAKQPTPRTSRDFPQSGTIFAVTLVRKESRCCSLGECKVTEGNTLPRKHTPEAYFLDGGQRGWGRLRDMELGAVDARRWRTEGGSGHSCCCIASALIFA